jgi:putative phosphoribosyl transferase
MEQIMTATNVPTLDHTIQETKQAFARLHAPKAIEIVAGATHLFPEPGAMDAVIGHAAHWFESHLIKPQCD